MAFLHSLLGANLFLFIYLAYPREVFVAYASWQLVASSILILLETPLLQHFLANRTEERLPRVVLFVKSALALLATLAFVLSGQGHAPAAIFVCLLVSLPTSWQVTPRTHGKVPQAALLAIRIILLAIPFTGIAMPWALVLFALGSSGCAAALARRQPRLQRSAFVDAARAFANKIAYAVRPAAESIAFNLATLFIMSQLSAAEASMFFVFLRVVASAVSVAQNALYTDFVGQAWQSAVQRFGPVFMAGAAVVGVLAVLAPHATAFTFVAFALGAPVVIINQYFGSYRAKILNLHRLDLLNGLLFSIGLAAMAGLSLFRKDFQSIAFTYLIVEAAIGLNAYRMTSRFP